MRNTILAVLLTITLAGCGQAATGALPTSTGVDTPSMAETTSPAPDEPTGEASNPTTAPEPTAAETTEAEPSAELVQRAKRALAEHLGVGEDALTLNQATAQEWPDGALGCPQADMMYPQVISPGYQLTFSADSRTYDVHTDQQGMQLVLCENGAPTNLSHSQPTQTTGDTPTTPPVIENPVLPTAGTPSESSAPASQGEQQAVGIAQQALAKDLGIDASASKLISIVPTEWSDSSLGCPKPGQAYLQVITPGYIVTLEAQGQRYEYHTDEGKRAVRCDKF